MKKKVAFIVKKKKMPISEFLVLSSQLLHISKVIKREMSEFTPW
jgi:hypothetical protein